MPTIVFSKSISLPIAPLREMLTRHLPLYSWRIGERDSGADKQMVEFAAHDLIAGRSASTVIFTELTAHREPLRTPAPPHQWHLQVGNPTTELKPIADRIVLVVCAVSMILDEQFARCQLKPGGPWLSADDLTRVLKLVVGGESIDIANGLGIPAAHFGGAPENRRVASTPTDPALAAIAAVPLLAPPLPGAAPAEVRIAGIGRTLPPLMLLLDPHFTPDWDHALEVARIVDREGDWTMHRDGTEMMFEGRGTRVIAAERASAVAQYRLDDALTRSFWLKGDARAYTRHSRHLTVGSPLDGATAEYETLRQVATVITAIFGALGRGDGVVALYNSGTGTLFEPDWAAPFVADLGSHELPVQLWTWTAPHDLTDGNICLSTSGLSAFLGHELEVWNAPITRDEAQERVSQTIIYLLQRGPVIQHGDVAGKTRGDRSIRCFKGPSRAPRPEPVEALFLEFSSNTEDVAPRPDVDPYAPAPVGDPLAALLADRAKPAVAPDANADMLQQIAALRAGSTPEEHAALDQLEKLVCNPPPQSVIDSDDNPVAKALGVIVKGVVDRETTPPAPPVAAPTFGRRVGGFGRKGL